MRHTFTNMPMAQGTGKRTALIVSYEGKVPAPFQGICCE